MSNCPRVQGRSNKPQGVCICVCVCVFFFFLVFFWGGGGKKLFHDFTSIFSFININEYANEIIFL